MNPLLKKEIRLLLPVWLAVLVLEIALPWFGTDEDAVIGMTPVFFFFGMILLAVEPFGREFSLGTFSSLMSQPMERRQVWQTKITVLLLGAALIFAAYFVSCELRLHLVWTGNRAVWWHENQMKDFRYAMIASVAVLFVALVGGLWTALLLRQIATAFWITFLAPTGIVVAVSLCLPDKYADNIHVVGTLLYGLGAIYTVAGFWLARRLFHQAQDAGWSGGVISFSPWRYFSTSTRPDASKRQRRPLAALLKKELQLHSISLFCAGLLLVLHLAIFILRITYVNSHKNSSAEVLSELFWWLWLVMPLIIGGTAVAEERKLGMTESQFCLPVSRRTQFAAKFIPVMIFGTLLGGVMPMLLESLAAWVNAPSDTFSARHYHAGQFGGPDLVWFEVCVVAAAAGLSWVSFFASTLARSFLQALSITVVTILGGWMFVSLLSLLRYLCDQPLLILWPTFLPIIIGVPTLLATLVWLVYRNFNWFHESWRLWRGNLLGILTAILFVIVSSAAIYNRVWEVLEPAEPAHGPAKVFLAKPPALRGDIFSSLQVRLPDGRVWVESWGNPVIVGNPASRWKPLSWLFANSLPALTGPRQFMAGSNWISATAGRVDLAWNFEKMGDSSGRIDGYLDTVGIQANGTLWISSRAGPKTWTGGEMTQFGDETNWQRVVRQYGGTFLLLRSDGTLWRWGTNHLDWRQWSANWPTVRNNPPRQIGTDSNWKEIFDGWLVNARKTDGSSWNVGLDFKTGQDKLERQPNFDRIPFRTLSSDYTGQAAYVSEDGTLWTSSGHVREEGMPWEGTGFLRVGRDTNWVGVAVHWPMLVALKADGSLWKWKPLQESTAELSQTPPTRLGIHSDWVGLTWMWGGAVSLAADGSLWFWPSTGPVERLLKSPKQPQFLGNVFQKS